MQMICRDVVETRLLVNETETETQGSETETEAIYKKGQSSVNGQYKVF